MKKTIRLLGILGIALGLNACASLKGGPSDPGQIYKGYTEPQLFAAAEKSLASRKYTQATRYFEGYQELYPFGANSQQAQLDVIYAYYESKDYSSAEAAADTYIHLYPQDQHVDYAYYMKGLSQIYQNQSYLQRVFPIDMSERNLTTAKQAFFTFSELVQLVPQSEYAPYARQQMVYLRNLFSQSELNVANYYFARKAYVAASNRASYIVRHYEGTPQVFDALVILVKANRALGATDAANEAYSVLQANYPNSPVVRKLAQ